ncbi:LysR family transcriptional regulator [Kribbella sp. NPDC003557]|uniref:LysR family transcriptional regulator n=1 Tax=Kribbella sp. NPDC003557 TaxID=3154449 RepID=UPI0033BBEDA7
MDPHLLRTFVTVAACGSFSAAAARLGYTQSAVSQHIAALESDLGTPLLRRRPVEPTPAGERLLEHAAPILLRLDAARADVRRTVADPPSTLTLAASPLAAGRLGTALAEVRRSYPGTETSLTVCGRAQVATGVAAGTFTLGLIDGIATPTDPLHLTTAVQLRTTPIAHDTLAVALPNHHPLALRPTTGLPAPASAGLPAQASAAQPDQASAGQPVPASAGLPAPASAGQPDQASAGQPDQASAGQPVRASAGRPDGASPRARRGLALGDLADARWIDAPDLAAPLPALRAAAGSDALRPAFTYNGTDLHTLLRLIASGHGLAVLPQSAITPDLAAVPLTTPRLVHRTELLHGHLTEPAAEALATALSTHE